MDATPVLPLTIAYWLHMLATVVWLGGLSSLALLVIPAARRSLPVEGYARFLGQIQTRLQQIGWFSLVVLAGTGMFQMISHPSYQGFLAVESTWAVAILVKHLAIGVMVIFSAYVTWGLTPALQRQALRQAAGKSVDIAEQARLQKREEWLLRLNLVLAVIILALTSIARAA